MFERYTEKGRRVIFFARYEASQYGSPYIETEHLLLGVLREDKQLAQHTLSGGARGASEAIREKVESLPRVGEKCSTSVDLPLSDPSKRVLAYAAQEAERLEHKHIGTEHLLLGLLLEKKEKAAQMLHELGVDLAGTREKIATWQREPIPAAGTIQIHGASYGLASIRSKVEYFQRGSWHWRQQAWLSRDVAEHIETGQTSFDVSLASDTAKYKLLKSGWTSDNCVICGWRLFESPTLANGIGYTNGRDWLCVECYEKFFLDAKPGPPPHPDIT